MDFITESSRQIPVCEHCDVLVAGGGFAGASAALAAARMGKKVMLIEREFLLGGLATLGLVTIYLPLCDGRGEQVSFGIAEELFHLSIRHGAQDRYPKPWLEGGSKEERARTRFLVQYNPWMFAIELEQLLKQNGVNILYGSAVCDVVLEDEKIKAVIIENKSGRSAVAVGSVVDATGDADLCKFAGAPTALYAPQNTLASWYYYCGDEGLKLKMYGFSDTDKDVGTDERISNAVFSGLDAAQTSQVLMDGREKMLELILQQQKNDPSLQPAAVSAIPQVRMTRRIVGETELDIAADHAFCPDSVGCIGNWCRKGPRYEIPFSSLYSAKVKNLITAGRCISVTAAMWDITRVIPACAVTGQAAGTAAAMSDDFTVLSVKDLQTALEKANVRLHP